jgi:hypothetical protein
MFHSVQLKLFLASLLSFKISKEWVVLDLTRLFAFYNMSSDKVNSLKKFWLNSPKAHCVSTHIWELGVCILCVLSSMKICRLGGTIDIIFQLLDHLDLTLLTYLGLYKLLNILLRLWRSINLHKFRLCNLLSV